LSLDKKSNIKDVCALLDLKSSKLFFFDNLSIDIDDVNKALAEMHNSVEAKVELKDYSAKMLELSKVN
jgi:hypothetical protein